MYPKKYVFWSKLRVLYSVVELQKVFVQTLNLNQTVVYKHSYATDMHSSGFYIIYYVEAYFWMCLEL